MFRNNRKLFRQLNNGFFICLIMLFGASSALAMTYRDNEVNMPLTASGYKIKSATYKLTDYYVTSGQDPRGHIYIGLTKDYSGNNGSMSFSVGRKGSSGAANWFKRQIPSSKTTFNHDPGKLNFAFIGTLTLNLTGGKLGGNSDTYTITDVGIAQGHTGGRNNWWFGGKNCQYKKSNSVTCDGKSSSGYTVKFVFERGGNGVNNIDLKSISYPQYKTTPLQSRYRGESTRCVWQPSAKCPPYVMYYNNSQSNTLKLTVRNNKLYNSVDQLFDTSGADPSHSGKAAIFVMSSEGDLYASNVNKVYLFHHSTILAGSNVAAAGELFVSQGVIQEVTNCSGHYMPGNFIFAQVKESLKRHGYSRDYSTDSCSQRRMLIDLDYKPVK